MKLPKSLAELLALPAFVDAVDRCLCGAPLPRHLADTVIRCNRSLNYSHVCSCGRRWRLQGSCFVHDRGDLQ